MRIAPHPAATRRFGPPEGWNPETDGECGTLEIADVTGEGGTPFMESLWRPEPEDLAALNLGARMVLGVSGTVHPVVYLGVSALPRHDGATAAPALGNPFTGLSKPTHDVIERLLAAVYRAGEWENEHEDLLDAWRAARGEDAKDHWLWWVGEVDAESYAEEAPTREDAIELGRARYADDGKFRICEARLWNDLVKEGEETSLFAEARNHEFVPAVTAEDKR